jgi:hypothetical protein
MKNQPNTTACQLCSAIMIVSVSHSYSNILKSLGSCILTKKQDMAVRFLNRVLCVKDCCKYWLLRLQVKIQTSIYSVSKMLRQISGLNSTHQKWGKKVLINVSPQTVFEVESNNISTSILCFFNLWRHLNPLVHSAALANKQTFHQRIFYARQTVLKCHGTFESVRQSIFRRVNTCTDIVGRHFEHLFWLVTW